VLHWTRDKEHYVLDVDKTLLKGAPGFDKKHWPDSSNKWDQLSEELNQFYGITSRTSKRPGTEINAATYKV